MRLVAVGSLALFALASAVRAEAPLSPSDRLAALPEPLQVFAMNCVAAMTTSEEQVRTRLSSDPAVMTYGSELTSQFLGDKPGKAWGFRGKDSTYVVALADNHTCMVFAADGNREGVLAGLDTTLDILFPAISRVALPSPLPENEQTSSKVYLLGLVGHPVVGATVNTDPQFNFSVRLVLVPPSRPEG